MTSLARLVYQGLRSRVAEMPVGAGGGRSPRYCYAVYLRHLVMAQRSHLDAAPRVVAELGPGDSLGVGFTALLAGAEKYYACDIVAHASPEASLAMLDELAQLLRDRSEIPDDEEFPEIEPKLGDYRFPFSPLPDSLPASALRAEHIRAALARADPRETAVGPIAYAAPWSDASLVPAGTVDMVLSQAVMEHVDDVDSVYRACHRWLKPGGFMSHQIDFRSHELAESWNGHWQYGESLWSVIRGRRPYLINRLPCSEHLARMRAAGFEIVACHPVSRHDGLGRAQLARRFQHLSDNDLTTACAFIQAKKRAAH